MRFSEGAEFILCEQANCPNKVKNHKWGQIKAPGWFFTKTTDKAYCPDHHPDWVTLWRKRKANDG